MQCATQRPFFVRPANWDQSPLASPRSPTHLDEPRKRVIALHKPPLCDRCTEKTEREMRYEGRQQAAKTFASSLNAGRTHLQAPCWIPEVDQTRRGAPHLPQDSLKHTPRASYQKLPAWMRLLPSNVNANVQTPRHSVLERRLSFPYIEHTRYSTPFSTPTEFRNGSDVQAAELSEALQGLVHRSVTHEPPRIVPISPDAQTAPRKVRFNLLSSGSTMTMPTPDLVHSPVTPTSAPRRMHHLRSHRPGTPESPVSVNHHLSHAINSTPLDQPNVPTSPQQLTFLQRRLSKPINFQEDP